MLLRNKFTALILVIALAKVPVCFAQSNQNLTIPPIPTPVKYEPNKIAAGKALFNAPLFSSNNTISCNSCHILNRGGTDNLPTYVGINKQPGTLNTPTVLNASLNFRQFWNGRAKSLADVVEDHLLDPTVFDNNWNVVIQRIKEKPKLVALFKDAYQGEINENTIKDALSVYQHTLLTPNSALDRFRVDKAAMSPDALKGYQLFKNYGCRTCHQGPGVGGNLYQKLGIYKDYFATKSKITKADLGLYNITGKEEDKYVFKVPSLRNVTLTAPYLHDGSAATLEEVIQIMGIYQVGQPIQPFDVPYIIKFLQSLSGKLPSDEPLIKQDTK